MPPPQQGDRHQLDAKREQGQDHAGYVCKGGGREERQCNRGSRACALDRGRLLPIGFHHEPGEQDQARHPNQQQRGKPRHRKGVARPSGRRQAGRHLGEIRDGFGVRWLHPGVAEPQACQQYRRCGQDQPEREGVARQRKAALVMHRQFPPCGRQTSIREGQSFAGLHRHIEFGAHGRGPIASVRAHPRHRELHHRAGDQHGHAFAPTSPNAPGSSFTSRASASPSAVRR